jgi:hypothetical protein
MVSRLPAAFLAAKSGIRVCESILGLWMAESVAADEANVSRHVLFGKKCFFASATLHRLSSSLFHLPTNVQVYRLTGCFLM